MTASNQSQSKSMLDNARPISYVCGYTQNFIQLHPIKILLILLAAPTVMMRRIIYNHISYIFFKIYSYNTQFVSSKKKTNIRHSHNSDHTPHCLSTPPNHVTSRVHLAASQLRRASSAGNQPTTG